jgi:TetR/AcrR family transcriptional regulator, regulator of cefoperazone and chloramphenicol sensitivity
MTAASGGKTRKAGRRLAATGADHVATRQRLLAAAGEVFAAKGFHGATVREICRRAKANIAAVNYHFRDKEELYLAVFEATCVSDHRLDPPGLMEAPGTPEQRLETFIRTFLRRLLSPGRPSWQGRLMAREVVEPTAALDYVVERMMRPTFEVLRKLVAAIIGGRAEDDRTIYAAASVMAQCLFYKHSESVIQRVYRGMVYDEPTIEVIAGEITAFSLAALRGLGQTHAASRGRKAKGASK